MKRINYLALTALLLPLAAAAGESGKAKIVTSFEKPSECLSAVEVNKIDGKEAKVQKLGFSIEPGVRDREHFILQSDGQRHDAGCDRARRSQF